MFPANNPDLEVLTGIIKEQINNSSSISTPILEKLINYSPNLNLKMS